MIGLKRFIRPSFAISVIGHGAALGLGLLLVGANSFQSIPPDAMVVDIVPPNEAPGLEGPRSDVPPKEAPRFEGTPSDARSSGSTVSSKSDNSSTAAQPLPPSASARPHPEETADQPDTAEMFARLALLGGRLGGGFAAPPINAAQAAYDFTAAFRERVSSCSALPAGIDPADQIRIVLRVSLNADGTLASPPQVLEPIESAKQQALLQNSISALQKCQPYTMLPAKRYKEWKTLDLIFYPMNFQGG
jgi:hypothetical protein